MTLELPPELEGRQVFRPADVPRLTRHGLRRLVVSGAVANPSLPGCAPEKGVWATAEAMDHPDLAEAVVSVVTDGKAVLVRQYAAFRHGLSTAFPNRMEIMVPVETTVRDRDFLEVVRVRSPAVLGEGIETVRSDLGIDVRITTPARTVIDLLRRMHRDKDDWRHGVEALRTFVGSGGDTLELTRLASCFEWWLPASLEAVVGGSRNCPCRPRWTTRRGSPTHTTHPRPSAGNTRRSTSAS